MNRLAMALLTLLCSFGPHPARAAEAPVLFVEQPIVLYELEDAGYDFGGLFGASGTRDLERLYREAPAYAAIVDTIGTDLGAAARGYQGRRPHAARIHRRRDRPRHGYALAALARRAAAAGRRRQPASTAAISTICAPKPAAARCG